MIGTRMALVNNAERKNANIYCRHKMHIDAALQLSFIGHLSMHYIYADDNS